MVNPAFAAGAATPELSASLVHTSAREERTSCATYCEYS